MGAKGNTPEITTQILNRDLAKIPSWAAKGNTPEIRTQILNMDLAKMSSWARKWKVNFNPSKTEHMLFTNKVFADIPPCKFYSNSSKMCF